MAIWAWFPNSNSLNYFILFFASLSGFAILLHEYFMYYDEKEYNEALKKSLNIMHFIPTKGEYKIDYYLQDDEEHFGDDIKSITLPAHTKNIQIFIRTEPLLDVEVRDSQYLFEGDNKESKKKCPIVNGYSNPFTKTKKKFWFDEQWHDWHNTLHLSGNRMLFQKMCYTDGFLINTKNKGEYALKTIFFVYCRRFKNIEKERVELIEIPLKVNVA